MRIPDTPDHVRARATAEAAAHRSLLTTRADGRRLSRAMLPFFRRRPPAGYGILATTGRRSGVRREVCVRAVRRGGRAYLVSLKPPAAMLAQPDVVSAWVLNLRADPHVELRLRDGCHAGVAREPSDPDEIAVARAALCDTVHRFDYGECLVHLRGRPSRRKIVALHEYWCDTGILIAIDLRAGPRLSRRSRCGPRARGGARR